MLRLWITTKMWFHNCKKQLYGSCWNFEQRQRKFNVQVPSLIESRKDLLKHLKTFWFSYYIGDVEERYISRKSGYARNNGESAIILEISKRTGENIINVIEKIKKLVLQNNYIPDFIRIDFFHESEKIVSMVNDPRK